MTVEYTWLNWNVDDENKKAGSDGDNDHSGKI